MLWTCGSKKKKNQFADVSTELQKSIFRADQLVITILIVLFPVLTFSSQHSADLVPQDVQVLYESGYDVKKNSTVEKQRPVRTNQHFFSLFLYNIT